MHILVQGCYWNAAPVQHWCSPCIAFWLKPIEQGGPGHLVLGTDCQRTQRTLVHSGATPNLFAMSALRGLRPPHMPLHVFRFRPIGCYSPSGRQQYQDTRSQSLVGDVAQSQHRSFHRIWNHEPLSTNHCQAVCGSTSWACLSSLLAHEAHMILKQHHQTIA